MSGTGLATSRSVARTVDIVVNGRRATLVVTPAATLLHVLRNDLALNGPKYGCGYGQCGACMVLVDGRAARACTIPAIAMDGRAVVTLEGLVVDGRPHPVQQAFIDAQAAQCGYCLNGMIVSVVALLAHDPRPDRAAVDRALSHNLCRCGAHVEIVDAVARAVDALASKRAPVAAASTPDPATGRVA